MAVTHARDRCHRLNLLPFRYHPLPLQFLQRTSACDQSQGSIFGASYTRFLSSRISYFILEIDSSWPMESLVPAT
jgi:hypothetical protein